MDGITPLEDLHPLRPLSGAEITLAVGIVRANIERGDEARIEMVELAEPAKNVVRNYRPGEPAAREAWVNAYHNDRSGVIRCRVSLDDETLVSQDYRPDSNPMIAPVEFMEIENALKVDPRFIAACERRGLTDLSLVTADPWSAGNFGIEFEKGRRVSHVFCWVRNDPLDHHYAHPIDGLNATVDINTGEIL
ncbi:MAG: tyramine oxidase, partial [Pseudomonadota bacterium]